MKFYSFYNLFHIDNSQDLFLYPCLLSFLSFLWCPLGLFLSVLLLLLKPNVNMEVSFPISQLCSSWRCLTRYNPTARVSFSPSSLLLPTSWLRKEVLGEALADCYSLFILSNLQIRISIPIHTENDLPSFLLSFCILIALLIFAITADLGWEHQSDCSLRAVRYLLDRRMLGRENSLDIWRQVMSPVSPVIGS